MSQLPGVLAAGAMMAPPGHVESESGYWIDRIAKRVTTECRAPGCHERGRAGTFAALGIPLQQGRDFDNGDRRDRPRS